MSSPCFPARTEREVAAHRDSGSVTAELAIGITALLIVAALVLGAIRWGTDAVAATSVASETARAITRGEEQGEALAGSESAVGSATWSANIGLDTVCVTAILLPPVPLASSVTVEQCVPR